MTTVSTKQMSWERRIDASMAWALRHWLLFANGLVLIYGGLPWLSPLARAHGQEWLGWLLFVLYTPLCHQLPERSFFVEGYQVAFCHREAALYTALFAGGLLFGALRRRLKPAPAWISGLLALPIILDGGSHLVDEVLHLGLRGGGDAPGTINFWLRMVTGALFAIAVLVSVYPRLERDLRRPEAVRA